MECWKPTCNVCKSSAESVEKIQVSSKSGRDKTGNVRQYVTVGVFMQPFLQWKRIKYYLLGVCVCSLSYPARNVHASYDTVPCGLLQLYHIFPHYLTNGTIKKVIKYEMCRLIFSVNLYETFIDLRRNDQDMIKMYIVLHVKYPLFLSNFNETWIFSTDFQKILKYQISRKSAQWERVDQVGTRIDTTKLTVAYHNFANAPDTTKFTWRPTGLGTGGHVTVIQFVNQVTKPSNV